MKFSKPSFLKSKLAFVLPAVALVSSPSVFAADGDVPNYAKDAMQSIMTMATEFLAETWPVVIAITIGLLSIRLFKKFSSRAV